MPAFRLAPVALGTLVCAALIGCASVEPRAGAAWRIEPLMRVSHGGDPANGRAYAALGEAYQGEGRWQEAAEAYSKAAFADPENAAAFHALGIAQAVLGRYDGAISAFGHAVDLAPESAQYLNNLGYALLLSGQYARALPFLRAALAREPGHEMARTNIARAEIMLRPAAAAAAAAPAVDPGAAPGAEPAPHPAPAGPVAAASPAATEAVGAPTSSVVADAASSTGAMAGAAPERLSGFRVEITNGNGMRGAATRLRDWLHERGAPQARLSNLRPFNSPRTQVEYQPGQLAAALEIVRRMPDGAGITRAPGETDRADVRVVIGHDLRVAAAACQGRWPCAAATPAAQLAAAR